MPAPRGLPTCGEPAPPSGRRPLWPEACALLFNQASTSSPTEELACLQEKTDPAQLKLMLLSETIPQFCIGAKSVPGHSGFRFLLCEREGG